MTSKNFVLAAGAAAIATAAAWPAAVLAEDAPFLVRVRAVQLDSSNSDSTGLNLSINKKIIPELDLAYFFTSHIAAELVLNYPRSQDLRSNGTDIGTLKHLPPTLTVQYRFTDFGAFKPYVGAGVNYTHFSNVSFDPAVVTALHPSIKSNSYGFAAQIGADYEVAKNLYLNLDVKKVEIQTDVSSSGAKVGTFKIDPWLIGFGVGKRF